MCKSDRIVEPYDFQEFARFQQDWGPHCEEPEIMQGWG